MTGTKKKILEYIQDNGQVTIQELLDVFSLSRVSIHKHVKSLLELGYIYKVGSAPRVFYVVNKQEEVHMQEDILLSEELKQLMQEQFFWVTSSGERLEGVEGFARWCRERGFSVNDKALEYQRIFSQYESARVHGLFDGTGRMKRVFGDDMQVDYVYYADLYAWEIFGKTKLGQMLLYAKQSQNAGLMKEVVDKIQKHVDALIHLYAVDAVAYIAPTVKRSVQCMDVLRKGLALTLPEIAIHKIIHDVRVPQKTLSKLADRIENARSTFWIDEKRQFETVLLIDDALGSGASFQEVSRKVKEQKIAKKVIGFAVVGSAKGFDVVSEV